VHHVDFGHSFAVSPDGKWLLVKHNQTHLYRLEGAEPKSLGVLEETDFSGGRGGLGFSTDGKHVVVANANGLVRCWDFTGEKPKEISPFDPATAFHPEGSRLAREPGRLLLPRLEGRFWQVWAFDGEEPRPWPNAEALRPDRAERFFPAFGGRWLQGWDDDINRRADLWAVGRNGWERVGEPFAEPHSRGIVSGDGKTFIATAKDAMNLVAWDLTDKPVKKWTVAHPTRNLGPWDWYLVASSHNGSRFALVTATNIAGVVEAMIFSATEAKAAYQMTVPIASFYKGRYAAALSPDGRYFVHTQADLTEEPEVLDVTGKEPKKVGSLPKLLGAVHWLAYSPDGNHLAAAGGKGVAVFDAATLKPVWKWDTSPGPVHWLDWAADGRHLVTHNGNKTVYVLRLKI
jgi:WD40 repeat protein